MAEPNLPVMVNHLREYLRRVRDAWLDPKTTPEEKDRIGQVVPQLYRAAGPSMPRHPRDFGKRFLFLGMRRSRKATAMGVTWENGNLAARPLFEALRAHGIDPGEQRFENLFREDLEGPLLVRPDIDSFLAAMTPAYRLVAMGNQVARELRARHIEHIKIVHPAARGRIRERAVYIQHIGEHLKED